jgi:hypothetical protein
MAGKQAKTLATDHVADLLFFTDALGIHSATLVVLLSVKAGLRCRNRPN